LIKANDMAKIAAFGRDQFCESVENEFTLAQIAGRAAQWQPGNPGDLRDDIILEIRRLVARKEQPGTSLNALRIENIGLADADGRDRLYVGHA
jgi:hypothetical protein